MGWKETMFIMTMIGLIIVSAISITGDDKIILDKKIDGNELIRHTGINDYEIWELQDKFNTIDIQDGIDVNEIELSALETEYKDCKELKDEKYISICEYDVLRKIDFIMGESVGYDVKLEKVK